MTQRRILLPRRLLLGAVLALLVGIPSLGAQPTSLPTTAPPSASTQRADDTLRAKPPGKEFAPELPAKVEVAPAATDAQIAARLERILRATGWFEEPLVKVDQGVVFLSGRTASTDRKVWAGDLARSTEAVVAVVNRLEVMEPALLDFGPALAGVRELWRDALIRAPWVLFGLIVFVLAYLGAHLTRYVLARVLRRRVASPVLRGIGAWVGGAAVFLLGLYVVLYVSGLTRLALTVLGGTGLIGLVLGIGFRDITENFLASVFLSIQTPYQNGDLVQVAGVTGFVQRMTLRSTLLMTFEGNHVQIPNSSVYKSTITNFTSNPNRREDFAASLPYEADVAKAQDVILTVLREHPAVLTDPEPMVLAEALGTPGVNLRVYFWVNVDQHSLLKVKSALIRLVKQAFQDSGMRFSQSPPPLPPEVAIRMLDPGDTREDHIRGETGQEKPTDVDGQPPDSGDGAVATRSEGNLSSEALVLKQQARQARPPEPGQDLLRPTTDGSATTAKS